jgi:hypothetical protein
MPLQRFTVGRMPGLAKVVRDTIAMLRVPGVVRGTTAPLAPREPRRVMRASLPLYHLPLMTLLVVLMFSINPMIYVLDQLQEHVPSYWNNR